MCVLSIFSTRVSVPIPKKSYMKSHSANQLSIYNHIICIFLIISSINIPISLCVIINMGFRVDHRVSHGINLLNDYSVSVIDQSHHACAFALIWLSTHGLGQSRKKPLKISARTLVW